MAWSDPHCTCESSWGLVRWDLVAAINDQCPRPGLWISATSAADEAVTLFHNGAYSFAGNLLAPIFRVSGLRAEVHRSEAVHTQRRYEYGQTILVSVRGGGLRHQSQCLIVTDSMCRH